MDVKAPQKEYKTNLNFFKTIKNKTKNLSLEITGVSVLNHQSIKRFWAFCLFYTATCFQITLQWMSNKISFSSSATHDGSFHFTGMCIIMTDHVVDLFSFVVLPCCARKLFSNVRPVFQMQIMLVLFQLNYTATGEWINKFFVYRNLGSFLFRKPSSSVTLSLMTGPG